MATFETPSKIDYVTVTIANGQTVSNAACLRGHMLLFVIFPGTLTSTTFGLQISQSLAGTYTAVLYGASDLSFTCAASKAVHVIDKELVADYVKVVAGSAEGGDRIVTLAMLRLE